MNEAIFRHSVHKEMVQEEMVNQEKLPFRFLLELGRDKLLEIEYFISFSRILRHNVHFGHTGELCSLNPHHPGGSVGVPLFGKHCPNFAWVSTCGFYHNFRQRLHVGDLDGSGY